MLNSANMYPWYRDSMSQLGQFCGPAATAAHIKTENGYNDCMIALDYAQNKVRNYFWLLIRSKSAKVVQNRLKKVAIGRNRTKSDKIGQNQSKLMQKRLFIATVCLLCYKLRKHYWLFFFGQIGQNLTKSDKMQQSGNKTGSEEN